MHHPLIKCFESVKCNINNVYITHSLCKLAFKCEFYFKFVSFGIKATTTSSMRLDITHQVWNQMGYDFVTESPRGRTI